MHCVYECRWVTLGLTCPYIEIKLKQKSFKTVSKLFLNCFASVSFRCADSFGVLVGFGFGLG